MAIGKPTAIMQLRTGPNGEQMMVYVDPATGQEVQNPTGYAITNSNITPLNDPQPVEKSTTAKQLYPRVIPVSGNGERDTRASHGISDPRNPSNNFGYVNKPDWASLVSIAPGPLGIAGKIGNAVVNANNVSAVNTARDMMNVPEQTFGEKAKGIAKDNKGFVGDYNINNETYGVGFEAMTPDGRTALTPNEARLRSNATGITQANKQQSAVNKAEFDRQNPQHHHGFISSIKDHLSQMLDGVFGNDQGGFPDAPTADRGPEGLGTGNRPPFAGPWGGGAGYDHTGYGSEGTSGQSVGPSGGGQSWGGPH